MKHSGNYAKEKFYEKDYQYRISHRYLEQCYDTASDKKYEIYNKVWYYLMERFDFYDIDLYIHSYNTFMFTISARCTTNTGNKVYYYITRDNTYITQ